MLCVGVDIKLVSKMEKKMRAMGVKFCLCEWHDWTFQVGFSHMVLLKSEMGVAFSG